MKYILILSTLLFAGELEIDGDLTVLGNVNAPGLGGMKPERIYSYLRLAQDNFQFTVPQNKIWIISGVSISDQLKLRINGEGLSLNDKYLGQITVLPGTSISEYNNFSSNFILSIYEYSISGSGTDQGMDYVEP